MEYKDQVFDGDKLVLDGNTFRNCTFRNVVLDYSGTGVTMSNCTFESFSFRFGGDLAEGLYTLYQLFGTEGMLKIIRGFTDSGDGKPIDL